MSPHPTKGLCKDVSGKYVEPEAAFWSYVDKECGYIPIVEGWAWQLGPCWLWRGSVDQLGYGIFGGDSLISKGSAYRFAYHVQAGELTNLDVHHLCFTPSCVRGSHLAQRPRGRHVTERLTEHHAERRATVIRQLRI